MYLSAYMVYMSCVWAKARGYINTSQCLISVWVICGGLVRIWAGGCMAHTTRMASDDISLIPQAQSCSLLLDKSSSTNLKPFYHTTHTEGMYEKMISMPFSHAQIVTAE